MRLFNSGQLLLKDCEHKKEFHRHLEDNTTLACRSAGGLGPHRAMGLFRVSSGLRLLSKSRFHARHSPQEPLQLPFELDQALARFFDDLVCSLSFLA